MWYRIDFIRFVHQLIPPILRGKVLMALLQSLIIPICYLYDKFNTYQEGVSSRLNMTGNVQYLQKVLNDTFFLTEQQIRIESSAEKRTTMFYFKHENKTVNYVHKKGGEAFYFGQTDNVAAMEDFIVYVPSFLCTSLDVDEDEYRGQHVQKIQDLLAYYKPAGRAYRIELYDYE